MRRPWRGARGLPRVADGDGSHRLSGPLNALYRRPFAQLCTPIAQNGVQFALQNGILHATPLEGLLPPRRTRQVNTAPADDVASPSEFLVVDRHRA